MLTPQQHKELSKFLSLVLRHEPQKLALTLGEEGFVPLAELLAAMQRTHRWERVTEAQVREVVAQSDKQRFEIIGENIRARYGHSVEESITYPEVEPPEILYHGTSPGAIIAIPREGLRPMKRQYVHLSTYVAQAEMVGRRHSPKPIVLSVYAKQAYEAGVRFYQPEPRLFLSTEIPPDFLREETESVSL